MRHSIEPSGLTTAELLDVAHAAGYPELTARLLETARSQRLISRPQRVTQEGRKPIWLSPPSTQEQVLTLARLRTDTTDPDLLRVRMWFAGYPQDTEVLRDSITTLLREAQEQIENELAKIATEEHSNLDREEARLRAADALAHRANAARGAHRIPRPRSAGPSQDEGFRILVHGLLLGQLPSDVPTDSDALDRTIGVLPRGRLDKPDGSVAWHDGTVDLQQLIDRASLPALLSAAETATDEELEAARVAAGQLFSGLRLISQAMRVMFGQQSKYAGLANFDKLVPSRDFGSEAFFVALMVSLARTDSATNLALVLDAVGDFVQLVERTHAVVQRIRPWDLAANISKLHGSTKDVATRALRMLGSAFE